MPFPSKSFDGDTYRDNEHCIFSSMALKCRRCSCNILRHSLKTDCSLCGGSLHIACVPMSRDEYTVHVYTVDNWICTLCCGDLFPFNHFEDELSFIDAIMECCLGIKNYTMNNQEKIFMPFELDEFEKKTCHCLI